MGPPRLVWLGGEVGDLVTIFRTQSDVEARIVQGLLEANGITAVSSSRLTHTVFPLTVNELGDVWLSVHPEDASEAVKVIDSYAVPRSTGEVVRLRDEFETLQRSIDYRFRDHGLLEHALTHTSRANEDASGGAADNESLEFLGDAVLGFLVADLLFHQMPASDEGQKSKVKASLVSTKTLARLADELRLGDHLLLGRGEEKTGGRRKPALLADVYEALIAAIYLDGGIEQARAFVAREFGPLVDEARQGHLVGQDHKSALQEFLQLRDDPLPEYRLTATTGPDHQKRFQVDVLVRGEAIAQGAGLSKKDAEQEAARLALDTLKA